MAFDEGMYGRSREATNAAVEKITVYVSDLAETQARKIDVVISIEVEQEIQARRLVALMEAANLKARQELESGDGWLSDHAAIIRDLNEQLISVLCWTSMLNGKRG